MYGDRLNSAGVDLSVAAERAQLLKAVKQCQLSSGAGGERPADPRTQQLQQ